MVEQDGKLDISTQHGFVEFCKSQAKAKVRSWEFEVTSAIKNEKDIGFLSRKINPDKAKFAARVVSEKESYLRVTEELASILDQSSEVYFSSAEGNWHLTAMGRDPGRLLRMGLQEGRPYLVNSGFDIDENMYTDDTRTRGRVYPSFFYLQYIGREALARAQSKGQAPVFSTIK